MIRILGLLCVYVISIIRLVWSKCCHFKKQGLILYVVSPIKCLMVNLLRCPWTFIKDTVSYIYRKIFCRALNCLSKGIVRRIYFQYLVSISSQYTLDITMFWTYLSVSNIVLYIEWEILIYRLLCALHAHVLSCALRAYQGKRIKNRQVWIIYIANIDLFASHFHLLFVRKSISAAFRWR